MPPIDPKLLRTTQHRTHGKGGAGSAVSQPVVQAPVQGGEPAVGGDTLGTRGAHAGTRKALGIETTSSSGLVVGGTRGTRTASAGVAAFTLVKQQLKRGAAVALLGIGLMQMGLNPAFAQPAMNQASQGSSVASRELATELDSKNLSAAHGAPPPLREHIDPNVPVTLAAVAAGDTLIAGRDLPIVLARPDGTQHDVRRPIGELPAQLIARDGFIVEHGDDPGDYYCEHALFVQQLYARNVGIVTNAHGETLTGFLHVPHDAHTTDAPDAVIDPAVRYAQHREVIGSAVFGFFHDAKKMTNDDVRILLTGYGRFMSITNNPAGGFVSDTRNIDAAMQHAFGDALLTHTGEPQPVRAGGDPNDSRTLAYVVKDGAGSRRILITAEQLDVADHELQDEPGSLVGAMRAVRPHAMLSLGVHGGTSFKVEFHADDGGLEVQTDGRLAHNGSKQPGRAFLDNYALARAIWQKQQATQTPTPRV